MSSSVPRLVPRRSSRRWRALSPFTLRPAMFFASLLVGALVLPDSVDAQPTFTLDIADVGAPSGGIASVPILLDGTAENRGVTFSVCNASPLVEPVSVDFGSAVTTINFGAPPQFFITELSPQACTISMVYSSGGPLVTLAAGVDLELAVIEYTVEPGLSAGTTFPLEVCITGNPPIEVLVIWNTAAITPTSIDGSIEVTGTLSATEFIRGDTNSDGAVGVTDAIYLLGILFGLVPDGSCPRAGDVNVSGGRDIADVVALLHGVIGSGGGIAAPYPTCGVSPATTTLICQPTSICP